MVAIKDREVTQADVSRVVETAKAIHISTDQRLLLVEHLLACPVFNKYCHDTQRNLLS